MATITAERSVAPPERGLAHETSWTAVARWGLVVGVAMSFVGAIGMLEVFDGRLLIDPILSLGYAALLWLPVVGGWVIVKRVELEGIETAPYTARDVAVGLVVGLVGGLLLFGFTLIVNGFDLRDAFPKMSPRLVDLLTFHLGLPAGAFVMTSVTAVLGAIGAALHLLGERWRRWLAVAAEAIIVFSLLEAIVSDILGADVLEPILDFIYTPVGSLTLAGSVVVGLLGVALVTLVQWRRTDRARREMSRARSTRQSAIAAVIIALLLLILPQLLGRVINDLLINVGIFVLMGLGLNIVVGLAGLLDIGYVAFFAVGAYGMAVLTSPIAPGISPELSFWIALPIVVVFAVIAGIMVGTPVIRMRGDYLAIVTLGFGEIVRILLLSDWLAPTFGGAQGIRSIPGIPVVGAEINATEPHQFIYVVIAFVLFAAFVSWRVQHSRVGRAWEAMREDETVAEATGVNTVQAKLLAFIIGAVLASFAGSLFAAKVGSVFTISFDVLVSIIILVVVIVGGMGNIVGVAVGAALLIGVLGGPKTTGLLQEFQEFKLLIYGALLVYMMLQRPEGLVPSVRRSRELHQEEFLQDAWLDKSGEFTSSETPAPTAVDGDEA